MPYLFFLLRERPSVVAVVHAVGATLCQADRRPRR